MGFLAQYGRRHVVHVDATHSYEEILAPIHCKYMSVYFNQKALDWSEILWIFNMTWKKIAMQVKANWNLSVLWCSSGWGLSRMMVWRGFAVTLGWNTFFLMLATIILKLRTWRTPVTGRSFRSWREASGESQASWRRQGLSLTQYFLMRLSRVEEWGFFTCSRAANQSSLLGWRLPQSSRSGSSFFIRTRTSHLRERIGAGSASVAFHQQVLYYKSNGMFVHVLAFDMS